MTYFFVGYVSYLCQNYPEIVEDGIYDSTTFVTSFSEKLKIEPLETSLTCYQTAELISGKCGLSQRGYSALKTILKKQKIWQPTYKKVKEHLAEVDAGSISKIECKC